MSPGLGFLIYEMEIVTSSVCQVLMGSGMQGIQSMQYS